MLFRSLNTLTQEYQLLIKDIIDDLFSNYWERGHYKKYDPAKGSLNNWVARYVNLYLNHFIKKHAVKKSDDSKQNRLDAVDPRNSANLVRIDKDNTKDDPDLQPDYLIDYNNPEELLLAKEMLSFAAGHFTATELNYMMGEVELDRAAYQSGCTSEAFRRKLDRRRQDFRLAVRILVR